MSKNYIGPFKDVAPLYIEYKKSLGYDCKSEESALKRMDTYFYNQNIKDVKLTKEMVENYGAKRDNEAISTQRKRLTLMKQFSLFLIKLGYKNIYVNNINPGKETSNFRPYIYTQNDITRIINYVDSHQYDYNSKTNFVLPIFIRILYSCGFRKGEVINLLKKDVDLGKKIITIVDGKGHVERIVPMSNSLYESYINYQKKLSVDSEYFICDLKGRKISRHVSDYFKQILKKLNILRPDGTPPRIHDFRFTFAVNALEQMEKNGSDLYTTLPILSKYLGHKNISATEHYLMLAKDYFINVISKENEYYKDLLKLEENNE